jgi:hypothetical protein
VLGNALWIVLADAVGPDQLWYALPLLVSVSLVYAATRHEEMVPILHHAVRFGIWVVVFMVVVLGVVLWLGALV